MRLPLSFPGGVVRRLRRSDLVAFQAYRGIPELGRYQGWVPMSELEAEAFLYWMEEAPLFMPDQWIQFGISAAGTDELIGDIGLVSLGDPYRGEVGFTLAPWAQGRGIATLAVGRALEFFFQVTLVQEVQGVADSRNEACIRLLERLGFRHCATRAAVFRGEECIEEVYVLSRADCQQAGAGCPCSAFE